MTELVPGQTLGKYLIRSVLGRGGMGIVYLAEDKTLGREVALKVLLPALDMDPHFVQMFSAEARLVAGLSHPNILPIHSFERIEGHLVLDMPYIEDGSLAQVRESCHVSLRQTMHWICQTLGALSECHRLGVVHRDVKPSNILLGSDGQSLLTDFGLAKSLNAIQSSVLTRGVSSAFFVGTPRYAPPEAWADAPPLPGWDVYSLGLILYEAVAPLPYDGVTLLEMARQVVERPILPLAEQSREVSPEFCAAVDKMVARDVATRYPDAETALEALMETPEGKAVVSAGNFTMRARKIRRRRFRAAPRFSGARRAYFTVVLAVVSIAAGFLLSLFPYAITHPHGNAALHGNGLSAPLSDGAYDVFAGDSAGECSGTVWLRNENDGIAAFALQAQSLWFATGAEDSNGKIALSGHWCEYTGNDGWVFRDGELTLEGRRMAEGPEIMFRASYSCEQDASRWTQPLILRTLRGAATPPDAAGAFEEHTYAQSLFYMELGPRGAAWLDAAEAFLYKGAHAPLRIAHFWNGGTDLPALTDILPNHSASYYRLDIVPQRERVAFIVRGLAPRSPFRLIARVTELFDAPARCSAAYCAEFPETGGAAENATMYDCAGSRPWECDWQSRNVGTSDLWKTEITIPIPPHLQPAPGAKGNRIRFSLSLVRGPENTPLAVWGATDDASAFRGRLLCLE